VAVALILEAAAVVIVEVEVVEGFSLALFFREMGLE